MESIEKLREAFEKCTYPINHELIELDTVWIPRVIVMAMLDDIEAEIERDYMKLPVDSDGVPIHVGDICEMSEVQFKVRQLNTDGYCWWAVDEAGEFYIAELCRHVKPCTLEDVLNEFAYKVCDLNVSQDDVSRYAGKIRELLGGDAS